MALETVIRACQLIPGFSSGTRNQFGSSGADDSYGSGQGSAFGNGYGAPSQAARRQMVFLFAVIFYGL